MSKIYVVINGAVPGVYSNWDDCKVNVTGYSGAIYKSFKNDLQAIEYIKGNTREGELRNKLISQINPNSQSLGTESQVTVSGNRGHVVVNFSENGKAGFPLTDNNTLEEIDQDKVKDIVGVLTGKITDVREKPNVLEDLTLKIEPFRTKSFPRSIFNSLTNEEIYMANNLTKVKEAQDVEKSSLDKSLLENSSIVAYVDGSFDNQYDIVGSGAVLCDGKKVYYANTGVKNEFISMSHNVSSEIRSSILAIEIAKALGHKSIVIHHDYEGVSKWATGQWKANKEAPIGYVEYIKANKDLIDISFIKVKAHSGNYFNEIADKLAANGVEEYKRLK